MSLSLGFSRTSTSYRTNTDLALGNYDTRRVKQDEMTWHLWLFNWSSRRSERGYRCAEVVLPRYPVQGDRLVPWSTSDGQGQAEMGRWRKSITIKRKL
jgi:hypothetical protein